MVRLLALLVVAALSGCDDVSTSRFDAAMASHEGRMDGLGDRISRVSASVDARFDLVQAQRQKDDRCSDVNTAPGGFARLGQTGLMVAVESMRRDDGSMDALVVNTLGLTIDSASIRVGAASALVGDLVPGKARKTKLHVPDGQGVIAVCAEDITFRYTKP